MLEEEQGKDGAMWTLEIVLLVLLKQSQVLFLYRTRS